MRHRDRVARVGRDAPVVDVGPRDVTLDHRLLGIRPRRTWLAFATIGAIVVLHVVSSVSTALLTTFEVLYRVSPALDGLSYVLIAAVAASITVLPVGYALWNGGPVTAFLGPLIPVAFADLVAGTYVLSLDVVVALTVGTTAATLAMYVTDVRRGTIHPWSGQALDEGALLFVSATTTVSLVAASQFVSTAPDHVVSWFAPVGVLFVLPVGVLAVYWGSWVRTELASDVDPTAE